MTSPKFALKDSGVRWLWLALLLAVIDVAVKLVVMNSMGYGWANRIEVLPFFNLLYVHNLGAAFSFLISMMRKLPKAEKWNNIAYAMVIGGAVGNVFDRLMHGYVIDFLDFYIGDSHWPAFNLADTFICIGAVMIVLDGFRNKEQKSDA